MEPEEEVLRLKSLIREYVLYNRDFLNSENIREQHDQFFEDFTRNDEVHEVLMEQP